MFAFAARCRVRMGWIPGTASWCLSPVQISCVRVSHCLKVNSQYFVRNVWTSQRCESAVCCFRCTMSFVCIGVSPVPESTVKAFCSHSASHYWLPSLDPASATNSNHLVCGWGRRGEKEQSDCTTLSLTIFGVTLICFLTVCGIVTIQTLLIPCEILHTLLTDIPP